jgi:chemotaxis protein histidine kinase CheA
MFSNIFINILMGVICYFVFEKYNLKYNLENGLIVILSCLVLNKLLKRVEGFEDGEEEPQMEEPSMESPQMEEPSMESPQMEEPSMESPDQEDSPSMTEDVIEEISMEEPQSEEPQMEEPQSEEPQSEEPQMEEPQMEEPQMEEPQAKEPQAKEEEESEIKPYSSEELKKLQSKYTIMPVESWIKNEISLMNESQKEGNKSCACPTLSRASNDYLEF